jgi:hypothetical protein
MSGPNGNSVTLACPRCETVITPRGKAMTRALVCTSCKGYVLVGSKERPKQEYKSEEPQVLALGSKGKVDGVNYEVIGFVIKRERVYRYKWNEYLLFNPYHGYAFLSEYNGHWNFIWPIEHDPRKSSVSGDFYHEQEEFKLYQKYSADVVYARGEFFFDVVGTTRDTINYDYIAPPRLLTLEQNEDSRLWCEGEYITPREIAEAFKIESSGLPRRQGIGYTQPFNKSFTDQALISLTVVLLLVTLVLQLVMNNNAAEQVIFSASYDRNELKDQKVVVTPSFELKGGTQSLAVNIHSPLSNDWFFSAFTLVNEADGSEYNFTKEIEFYSGYDGDGYWTEGSKSAEAFLSKIPEGKYHLNIYPEYGFGTQSFDIAVIRDVPMYSNFFVVALILVIFPIFHFIRQRYREQRRWADSDYSPYHTED